MCEEEQGSSVLVRCLAANEQPRQLVESMADRYELIPTAL